MQNILVILGHPLGGSFNHAVATQVLRTLERLGHNAWFHDLYAEGFDPVLSEQEVRRGFSFDERVQQHGEQLLAADGLILVHPDWWGQPPALVKGWLDRVLRPGVAYAFEGPEFLRKKRIPLLAGKKGLALVTTDVAAADRPHPIEALWKEGVFRYCGMDPADCLVFHGAFDSSPADRGRWLALVAGKVEEWFPGGHGLAVRHG